jgi:hypothetical protein
VNLDPNQVILPLGAGDVVLHDNGPLVNSPGTGAGGADESVLQDESLGLNTLGVGNQIPPINNWIADDFVVPTGGWDITKFVFYAYQTSAPTTSTINDVRFIIYDGVPGATGTNIVWGDGNTNRLTNTIWSDIYRVTETTGGATNRPIMQNTCDVTINLPAGTYWVAWQVGGSASYSGPWAPPITINGQTTTGNGMQSISGGAYATYLDIGTSTAQGFPFVIYGAESVPVSNWAIVIGLVLIGAFIVVRYRTRLA